MKLNIGDTVTFVVYGQERTGTVMQTDASDHKQPYLLEDSHGDTHWPTVDSIQFEGDPDMIRIEAKLDAIIQYFGIPSV